MGSVDTAIKLLQAAKGDRGKLALAALEVVLQSRESSLRATFEAAAIPHWFDSSILAVLLDIDEAETAEQIRELVQLPTVESFAARDGYNVHEATRLALRAQLAAERPDVLDDLSARATLSFAGDLPYDRVEAIFHLLRADPVPGAKALDRLYTEWDRAGRLEALQGLGVALEELIEADALASAPRARALLCYGWIREERIAVTRAEEVAREASELMAEISNEAGLADAHQHLGDVLMSGGTVQGARTEYEADKAIRLRLTQHDPDNLGWQRGLSVSLNNVGGILESDGQFAAALREYERDLEIAEKLVEQDPSNSSWKRDLLVTGGRREASARSAVEALAAAELACLPAAAVVTPGNARTLMAHTDCSGKS